MQIIFVIIFAIFSINALAQSDHVIPMQDAKGNYIEGKNSLYFKKYGQKGLEKLVYLEMAKKNQEKPVSGKKIPYHSKVEFSRDNASEFRDEQGITHNITGAKILDNSKEDGCGQSIDVGYSQYDYKILVEGKMHKLHVDFTQCSLLWYDPVKKQGILDADYYNKNRLKLYRDGKKIFDLNISGEPEYFLYKNELIIETDEPHDADSHFEQYNWLAGNVINNDLLHVESSDF